MTTYKFIEDFFLKTKKEDSSRQYHTERYRHKHNPSFILIGLHKGRINISNILQLNMYHHVKSTIPYLPSHQCHPVGQHSASER